MLHPVVDRVAAGYLQAVDAEAPGLVEGLYLVGSVALGDFGPRSSDIDFLAVTRRRLDPAQLAALERVHRQVRRRWRRPHFDGSYLTWTDLAGDPLAAGPCPHSHEGRFRADQHGGPSDPVAWHTLARYGIALRGPEPAQLDLWTDTDALATWCVQNLDSYWRPLLDRASRPYSLFGLFGLTPYATVWTVTGVSRLHYTLSTGDICSKQAAARYALATFPQRWHRVAAEALRIRRRDGAGSGVVGAVLAGWADYLPRPRSADARPLYRNPIARRADLLAFTRMVIDDARDRYHQV